MYTTVFILCSFVKERLDLSEHTVDYRYGVWVWGWAGGVCSHFDIFEILHPSAFSSTQMVGIWHLPYLVLPVVLNKYLQIHREHTIK